MTMTETISDWLSIAGDEKADSILSLVTEPVSEIAEIGCGTGAVLEALDRRGFADRYWACEPSLELFDQVRRDKVTRLQALENVTFDAAFGGRRFDLVVLSHVVEHLLAPADLVHQALERADLVFVEVPIEGGIAGRARMSVKQALGEHPLDNAAGHVQFFSRASAHQLVRFAGGEVVRSRGYFPTAPYRAQQQNTLRRAVLALADRVEPVAQRYYEHYAMLIKPASVQSWTHHYAKPQ